MLNRDDRDCLSTEIITHWSPQFLFMHGLVCFHIWSSQKVAVDSQLQGKRFKISQCLISTGNDRRICSSPSRIIPSRIDCIIFVEGKVERAEITLTWNDWNETIMEYRKTSANDTSFSLNASSRTHPVISNMSVSRYSFIVYFISKLPLPDISVVNPSLRICDTIIARFYQWLEVQESEGT